MKTLQVGNDWFGERQGGLNRVYGELLTNLPQVGVEVHGLVAGLPSVEQVSDRTVHPFAPSQAPLLQRMRSARRAGINAMRDTQIDLIASHFALYTFPFADHLSKRPCVTHFHGPWAAESGVEGQSTLAAKFQAMMERTVYQRSKRFIVLSNAFRRVLTGTYGVADENVRVVPGGIDSNRFNDRLTRYDARVQLKWPNDRPIVLAVRRQVRRMGLENLIDATTEIRKRVPEVLVLLAGSGPLLPELKQKIASLGLENNVRQLGRVDDADLPIAYRAADLSVVPSQTLEGFGMITLESLASGTPVVVTPVGGLPEVIQPFAPQCILDDGSVATIAAKIADLLLGFQELPTSDACRSYAIGNFDWNVIAKQTLRVYEEALQ